MTTYGHFADQHNVRNTALPDGTGGARPTNDRTFRELHRGFEKRDNAHGAGVNRVTLTQLNVAYRCVALECVQCDLRVTDGISTAMIDKHEKHFDKVTIEIQIIDTGEIWVMQPPPPHCC